MITKEIPTSVTDINWGMSTFTPETRQRDDKIGVMRVRIGKIVYFNSQQAEGKPIIETRLQENADDDSSSIILGYPGRDNTIRAITSPTRPLSIEDSDRINAIAQLAIRSAVCDKASRSSARVQNEGQHYSYNIQTLLGEEDNLVESLAVLSEKLRELVDVKYPADFLEIADEMDKLGIAEIELGLMGPSVTADHLRRLFSSGADTK